MSEQLGLFGNVEDIPAAIPGDWRVRVSSRARRLIINIHPNGAVEVVAPKRTSARAVRQFVEEHSDWIAKHAKPRRAEDSRLPNTVELPALDMQYRVDYRHEPKSSVSVVGDWLFINAPAQRHAEALRKWLRDTAKTHLAPSLQRTADRVGVTYQRAQFRLQRTRWGSCSSTGTISINAAVLLLRPDLCRYLLTHEVCHLRHMNHSKRFWNLVEKHCPGGRALDRELGDSRFDLPAWVYS